MVFKVTPNPKGFMMFLVGFLPSQSDCEFLRIPHGAMDTSASISGLTVLGRRVTLVRHIRRVVGHRDSPLAGLMGKEVLLSSKHPTATFIHSQHSPFQPQSFLVPASPSKFHTQLSPAAQRRKSFFVGGLCWISQGQWSNPSPYPTH